MRQDELTGSRLIDMILDASKQNGTGQWTSQSAMDLHVPIPVIDASVAMRDLSALKAQRTDAHKVLHWHKEVFHGTDTELVSCLENALYFGMIVTYAQGMALLQRASNEYGYGLKIADVARIWRGGCIIRSALLDDILTAYTSQPELVNLMVDEELALKLESCQDGFRIALKTAIGAGVPVPCMMAALASYDGYRNSWLPANLIQAQRDYFGAHTYERTDRKGTFHTQWEQKTQ